MIQHKKVVLLGSSALKIGEAGEFDYSGSQAIKALKEENISTILINPNIATIQTSEHLADKVYFLPVTPYFVEKVIEKERPTGLLLSFGGQTALNCGLELWRNGILDKYGVEVLGTPIQVIEETENRERFVSRLKEIDVDVPRSIAADSVDQAVEVAEEIGFPVIVRIAYALGGLGSGICHTSDEVKELTTRAFAYTPQILVEEYLQGWKEIEYEVVRDRFDNCITVCNMENFDPMGIHTGESIVVAPSQTLNNEEYHRLREIAIKVIRHLGVVGECNIQYALHPSTGEYRVIEVNARLSRSSALASKATGYPLAFIAAKLALGYSLVDLKNKITQSTMACFEPALDYVVVKIPRWDLKKFSKVSKRLGSAMKSVGEVMGIGRKFEEALQKALRMLEIGVDGLVGNEFNFEDLEDELKHPTDERVFAIADAIEQGYSIERIHELSHIDKWFLYKIQNIVKIADLLKRYAGGIAPKDLLLEAKQLGFSDVQIARYLKLSEFQVMTLRKNYGIFPCVKQIDTLAAEYPAKSNFLYLTYNGENNDVNPTGGKSVMVLGSGVYRIGSSVEFDWCCVSAVMTLRELGYQTILINYNPETVSTDFDECDRLYFEEITFETIYDIYKKEKPIGVIVSMGGQTPNNLALRLHQAGVRVLGTPPEKIDQAEDRHKFSTLLDQLGIDQPAWKELNSIEEAKNFVKEHHYPVLVRPSYVLSGSAMAVAMNDQSLEKFLGKAVEVSPEHPVVMSKFIEHAKEIEFDGVAKNGKLLVYAISEHVENAGVHSGDATLVVPPQRMYIETLRKVRKIAQKIAAALSVTGPFNIQFIAKRNEVKVIECNLRASRSFPFVSKVYKANFIAQATRAIMDEPLDDLNISYLNLDYVGVKAPQFSYTRLEGADPTLGVEMNSTGEVGCLGDDFEEAFLKAMLSVGYRLNVTSVLLSTGPLEDKAKFISAARQLQRMGIKIYATRGSAEFMGQYNIQAEVLHWPLDKKQPNVVDYLNSGAIDLVINIPKNFQEEELTNDYIIRRKAVDMGIPLITELQLAQRFVESIASKGLEDLQIKSWNEYP
ncbi:MAG: carbamoyl-phosphate synthase (glutamine-hydrolyzing) large subunit [Calditrichaeota bacterium]|nr:MAG: carbamoyl-phosphate synthase (glutamine-hydrolyzing) large subunit [Calditrichota bacterium]